MQFSVILVSHPTGNTFVRALLKGLSSADREYLFCTTLAVQAESSWLKWLPARISNEFNRRSYEVPAARLVTQSTRECGRLLFSRLPGLSFLSESRFFSIDAVYENLDRSVAKLLGTSNREIDAVYAYEDGAAETFIQARRMGLHCFYELPIAYWETSQRLLKEEAERLPEWEPTLVGTRDSSAKLDRKTSELENADIVVCPSIFVRDSLPPAARLNKKCIVAEFGSPQNLLPERPENEPGKGPLRVLFVGSMTQRKGLADLFTAMRLLKGSNVELTVMGSPVLPLQFYRDQLSAFKFEPPRPHLDVLKLMQVCDLLVLPSIVEGRALVQQEALSCGLPLLTTRNAGGEDLIEPGKTGFLVSIRSPEQIAERITWFDQNRSEMREMRRCAREKAREYSWERYCSKILDVLPGSGNK